MIDRLSGAGISIDNSCQTLGVSRQGLLPLQTPTDVQDAAAPPMADRPDPRGPRSVTGHIRLPAIHAELTMAMGVTLSACLVSVLMAQVGI